MEQTRNPKYRAGIGPEKTEERAIEYGVPGIRGFIVSLCPVAPCKSQESCSRSLAKC